MHVLVAFGRLEIPEQRQICMLTWRVSMSFPLPKGSASFFRISAHPVGKQVARRVQHLYHVGICNS